MLLRANQVIPHHLPRLRFLQRQMLLLHNLLHQTPMQQLPRRAPLLAMLHEQNMIAGRNVIRHVRCGTIGVERASLVDELFD